MCILKCYFLPFSNEETWPRLHDYVEIIGFYSSRNLWKCFPFQFPTKMWKMISQEHVAFISCKVKYKGRTWKQHARSCYHNSMIPLLTLELTIQNMHGMVYEITDRWEQNKYKRSTVMVIITRHQQIFVGIKNDKKTTCRSQSRSR